MIRSERELTKTENKIRYGIGKVKGTPINEKKKQYGTKQNVTTENSDTQQEETEQNKSEIRHKREKKIIRRKKQYEIKQHGKKKQTAVMDDEREVT